MRPFCDDMTVDSLSKHKNKQTMYLIRCIIIYNILIPMFHPLTAGHTALWSDACKLTTNNLSNVYTASCCVPVYSVLCVG
jgi:hypothetical protein